jgi:S1-C subfamily serine protease
MYRFCLSTILLCASCAGQTTADEPQASQTIGSWEQAAAKLQQATVTVRIWAQVPELSAKTELNQSPKDQAASVTICSGVCAGEGRIVTAAYAGSDAPIRLTLPGGQQASARLQILDEYSGLALLKTDRLPLTPLPLVNNLPTVGAELLSAAAWGAESPLISRGIVGANDRKYLGGNYPPLIQCDMLTSETSSGAALVNRDGQLSGILVASDRQEGQRGWAYAVPASHVERILRTADQQQGDGVIVLKRRRPIVGMVLDQQDNSVIVQRVTPGGPADRAGIKAADRLLATDGVAIRSVYQAVLPTLYKQPGDTTTFRIQRSDGVRDIQVVLGGGIELASAPQAMLSEIFQPKVRLARDEKGMIVANRPAVDARLLATQPGEQPLPPQAPTVADKVALLEKALARYQTVIELQQKQLADEAKVREEQQAIIQSLREEIDALRKSLAAEKVK